MKLVNGSIIILSWDKKLVAAEYKNLHQSILQEFLPTKISIDDKSSITLTKVQELYTRETLLLVCFSIATSWDLINHNAEICRTLFYMNAIYSGTTFGQLART